MVNWLNRLPKELQELIYLAGDISDKNNMPAYLVGGFVRDLLLGVKNLDLDIVVEGDGIKFAEDFSGMLKAKLIRHRRFGTATVVLSPVRDYRQTGERYGISNGVRHNLKIDPSTSSLDFARDDPERVKRVEGLRVNGESFDVAQDASKDAELVEARSRTIDIATARSEFYPEPASLPLVTSGRLKDDLIRRDFTINAMAISIGRRNFGRIIDLFAGKEDLRNKKIRILHNLSFIDDPTRMLRAVRFEKRYNFSMEPKTLALLKKASRLKMLERVQPQRLRDELILILKEEYPLKQLKRIQELVGFGFISPHLSKSKLDYRLLDSVETQINWFKMNYPQRRLLDIWLIYFMELINPLDIKDIKTICKKFSFRRGEERRILGYKRINRRFILELEKTKIKPSRIFSLLEPLSYEVIILIKAKYKNRNIQRHIEDFFEIYNGMRVLISGEDLSRLGIAPGPFYQKIFTEVLNAKLEGIVKTREEELALIKELLHTR